MLTHYYSNDLNTERTLLNVTSEAGMVPPFYGSGPCGHSFTSLAPIERSARSFRRDLRFDDAMD